jgi:formylglycine-generating enzyme required for sulfatase activity
MGSDDREADNDEKPVHTVRITQPFYLGKYEVTQGQWQAVMETNPSQFTGDPNRPVDSVSWDDVQEFIRRLHSQEGGATYRLPTEAEWEYAARAGTTRPAGALGMRRASSDAMPGIKGMLEGRRILWGNSNPQPNPWGLYDMHGNVAEWVQDWYGSYASGTAVDPAGPSSGSYRVVRGGSRCFTTRACWSTRRYHFAPGDREDGLGFRLLRVAQ